MTHFFLRISKVFCLTNVNRFLEEYFHLWKCRCFYCRFIVTFEKESSAWMHDYVYDTLLYNVKYISILAYKKEKKIAWLCLEKKYSMLIYYYKIFSNKNRLPKPTSFSYYCHYYLITLFSFFPLFMNNMQTSGFLLHASLHIPEQAASG